MVGVSFFLLDNYHSDYNLLLVVCSTYFYWRTSKTIIVLQQLGTLTKQATASVLGNDSQTGNIWPHFVSRLGNRFQNK